MSEKLQLRQEEERLLRELGKKVELGFNLMNQAGQLLSQNSPQPALEKLREAEALFREEKSPVPVERALRAQVQLLERLNDPAKVLSALQKLEAHHREAGDDDDDLAECLSKQVMVLADMGDRRKEVDVIKRLLPVLQRQGNKRSIANFCGAAASALIELNEDLDAAVDMAYQCELVCRELGDLSGIAQALSTKALALAGVKRLREALVACTTSIRIAKEKGIADLVENNQLMLEPLLREQFLAAYKTLFADAAIGMGLVARDPEQVKETWAELADASTLSGDPEVRKSIAKINSSVAQLLEACLALTPDERAALRTHLSSSGKPTG